MAIIDIFFLIMLAIFWGQLKRHILLTWEILTTAWRSLKRYTHRHGHSSRPATSTISDGRRR